MYRTANTTNTQTLAIYIHSFIHNFIAECLNHNVIMSLTLYMKQDKNYTPQDYNVHIWGAKYSKTCEKYKAKGKTLNHHPQKCNP